MTDANTTVTLPHPNPPAERVFKKTLPCYVILVHGVNDVGEAYEAQENGLCWGLVERLGRNHDLQPYEYKLPKNNDSLTPTPDRVFFHRVEGSGSHSPVIPFYWGFREEDGKIQKNDKRAHGEWLDACGNRIDKDGAKGEVLSRTPVIACRTCGRVAGNQISRPGWPTPRRRPRTGSTTKRLTGGTRCSRPFD
jgi:hypothetical protein